MAGCNMSSGGGGGGNPPPGGAISVQITSPANPNNVNVQADIGTQNFIATVTNDNAGVAWTLTLSNGAGCNGNTCGSLSNSTSGSGVAITYTAPAVPPASSVTLTAASVTDKSKTANATIIVTPAVAVAPSPSNANAINLQADLGSQQFSVTINNDAANAGVNWTLGGTGCNGSACGTLSATSSKSGNPITYNAPSVAPNPATVTLTATSVTDANQKLSWTINLTPAVSVGISSPNPSNVNVQADIGTQSFTASVSHDAQNAGVKWTLAGAGCSGAACGILSSSASGSGVAITYSAPATPPNPATVTLTATSVTDINQSAPATITITPAVAVSASASIPAVPVTLTAKLTATVSNDAQNKGVNWIMTIGGAACTVAVCGFLSSPSSPSGTPVTYTAPASLPPAPAMVTFTATSVTDPNESSAASVTITLPISVSVASVSTPPRTNYPLQVTQVQAFSATVTNDPNGQGVTWTLSTLSIAGCGGLSPPAACGSLSGPSSTGVTYNAPANVSAGQNPTVFTLTATSVFDPTQSAAATIPVSQGIPTTTGWFEVPNTYIEPICPADPEIHGADGCKGAISAWSGGVADTTKNRLLFTGGGHQNYWGNEVYALDLNSASASFLTVSHINNPTLPAGGVPSCTDDWGSPSAIPPIPSAPAARETYGDLAYMSKVNEMWLFGGALGTSGCRSTGMWSLDLATLTWTQLNQTLKITSPTLGNPGNITLNPSGVSGSTPTDINYSDYDPNAGTGSGLVYSYIADADIFASYDPASNTLTSLQWGNLSGQTNFRANGVLDPKRHIFLIVGQGTLAWFDLNTSPPTFHNPYNSAQPSSSSVFPCIPSPPSVDATAVGNAISPGLAYDSVADRVVGWAGGNNIYVIDTTQAVSAGTLTCHALTTSPGGPPAQQTNGTFGRFRYFAALDLFAVVNDWQQNAFTFRPANPLP